MFEMAAVNEMSRQMRQEALTAALRNINLHHFKGKAGSAKLYEFVAGQLGVMPPTIRLWLLSDGVPEEYVQPMLNLLNEHSVWNRHQLLPPKRLVESYMVVSHA